MKIVVIGANGQLGTDVSEKFTASGDEVCRLTHADLDISAEESLHGVLDPLKPALIANTAAMHHVEHCEKEPLKAYAVNALGARNLARVARDLDVPLLHVSTDYVFDGTKGEPYVESDEAVPLNVYGNTKLAGEAFIRATTPKHFIVRSSALYGRNPCRAKGGPNFVELMLKLAKERGTVRVVDDETISPTSTIELAAQMVLLTRTDRFGLYHATAEGSCTWFEFAKRVFEIAKVKVDLIVASPNEFPSKVLRPKYSVLENRKLKTLGMNHIGAWEHGLRSYLASSGRMGELEGSAIGATP